MRPPSQCRIVHIQRHGYYMRMLLSHSKTLCIIGLATLLLGIATLMVRSAPAVAGGETRTIDLYRVNTKERLTITYMKQGRYILSAMRKIDYILRDWQRNEIITMSPRTIDLLWELHADLGSQQPIHIVSAYRSPKSRVFAEGVLCDPDCDQMHTDGRAIDIYFPDVPSITVRNSALVRQVGGVGYYSSGAGPTGFIHIDSGRVRNWGPAISNAEMATIMLDYRKTVGARLNKMRQEEVTDAEVAIGDASAAGLPSEQEAGSTLAKLSPKRRIPLETAYTQDDEELARMGENAAVAPKQPKAKPESAETEETDLSEDRQLVAEVPEGITQGHPVPKPRPKPIEVLMMAEVHRNLSPLLEMQSDDVGADRERRSKIVESIKPFVRKFKECTIWPPGAREAPMTVALSISFNADGSVFGQPRILNATDTLEFNRIAQAAINGIMSCQNYDNLPNRLLNGSSDLVIDVNPNMFDESWSLAANLVEREFETSRNGKPFDFSDVCSQSLTVDGEELNTDISPFEALRRAEAFSLTLDFCRSQLDLPTEQTVPMTKADIIPAIAPGYADARDKDRTISLRRVETGELLTVQYMKDGRYLEQPLHAINFLLRDISSGEVRTFAPPVLDLVWELHADLGSKQPIEIVNGLSNDGEKYLEESKNITRGVVAPHSDGSAIDFFFPDISVYDVYGSAVIRQVGGVALFSNKTLNRLVLHVDANGASVKPNDFNELAVKYRYTLGARFSNRPNEQAAEETNSPKESDRVHSKSEIAQLPELAAKSSNQAFAGVDEPPALLAPPTGSGQDIRDAQDYAAPDTDAPSLNERLVVNRSGKENLSTKSQTIANGTDSVAEYASGDVTVGVEVETKLKVTLAKNSDVIRPSASTPKAQWRAVMNMLGHYNARYKCWHVKSADGHFCMRPAKLLEVNHRDTNLLHFAISGIEKIPLANGDLETRLGFNTNVVAFVVLSRKSQTEYSVLNVSNLYFFGGWEGYPASESELDFLRINETEGVWTVKSYDNGAGGVSFVSTAILGPFGKDLTIKDGVLAQFPSEMNNIGGCAGGTDFMCVQEQVTPEFVTSSRKNNKWPDLLLQYAERSGGDEIFEGGAARVEVIKELRIPVTVKSGYETLVYNLPVGDHRDLLDWFKRNSYVNNKSIVVRSIGATVELLSDAEICRGAYNANRKDWEQSPLFKESVGEAFRRGLTLDNCVSLLNLNIQ